MQSSFNKVHHRFVGSFAARARHLFPGLLLFTAPHVNENHQHAGFDQLRIDGERFIKGYFGSLEVFGAAQSLKHTVYIRSAQAVVSEREIGIQLDRALEVFDSSAAIFRRNSAEDKTGKQIPAARSEERRVGKECRA